MKRLSAEEYERLIQDSFPHLSLCGEYRRMHSDVTMACARCGGKFRRLAFVNTRSECPICFKVYHRIHHVPQGFREAIAGLEDIRDLGKGNLDYHLGKKDPPVEELAEKYRGLGRWGSLMQVPEKGKGKTINAIVDELIEKFAKGL